VNTEAETPDDDDDPQIDFYESQPLYLCDGDCQIFDLTEFSEAFDALAVQFKGGDLWVLTRETLEWLKVEAKKPAAKPRPFKTVQ
jgi:hypothetical protein